MPEYTTITVNLTEKAVNALEEACTWTGHSKTDTINRAIQVYARLEQEMGSGAIVWLQRRPPADPSPSIFKRLMKILGYQRAHLSSFDYE